MKNFCQLWVVLISVTTGIFSAPAVVTRDVGFPEGRDPVPASHKCIDPQEIFNDTTVIYRTAATEPSIEVNPANPLNAIATWQNDRINNAGALEGGVAYTFDGGRTWTQTTVPMQICSGGLSQRISDVWLSWSSDGKIAYLNWLFDDATRLPHTNHQSGIAVVTSEDGGVTWSKPIIVESSPAFLNRKSTIPPKDDKNSIFADPNNPKVAYIVWDQFPNSMTSHSNILFSKTVNRGKSWSKPKLIYNPFPDLLATGLSNGIQNDCGVIDTQIIRLPSSQGGDLLNFMSRFYAAPGATTAQYESDSFPFKFALKDIIIIRSSDNGATWTPTATVISSVTPDAAIFTGGYSYNQSGGIKKGLGTILRAGSSSIFSADVSNRLVAVNPASGTLYVVWASGGFRKDQLPQIALSTSRDGGVTWTKPVRINRTPSKAPNPQAFTPAVAVTSQDGFVGFLYNDFRKDRTPAGTIPPSKATLTDTWLAVYKEVKPGSNDDTTGIGLKFIKEFRLSKKSFIAQDAPLTSQGVMTGDYITLVATEDKFFAAYTNTLPGPFSPPKTFFVDKAHKAKILLDNNRRQAPFVSVVSIDSLKE